MALLVVDLRVKKGEQLPRIVPDSLWERIEPLLPKVERQPAPSGPETAG